MPFFYFPCSEVRIWATEEEDMNVIYTNKTLAEDFLDYFQGINYFFVLIAIQSREDMTYP